MPALVVLALLSFLVNLGYGIVLPVLPELAHATAFDVGLMYTAFSATKLVAQLYGGASADRFGPGFVVRAGTALYAVSLAGLAAAHSVALVLVFRVLEGIAVGLAVPAVSALVLGTSDEASFTKRHGVVLGVGGAGMVMGPVVGVLVGRESVRPAMLVIAGITLLAALVAPRMTTNLASKDEDAFTPAALLRYARSGPFWLLVAPLAFGKLAFGVLQPLLPLHAKRIALSDELVAALFALTGILFAVTQPIVGVLSARVSPRSIARACTVLAAACLGSIAFFPERVGFSTGYLLYVAFGSMLFGANASLVGESYREASSDHGKVFGAMHSVTDASMLLAPPLLLSLYARSVTGCFVSLGALGLGAAALFSLGAPKRT